MIAGTVVNQTKHSPIGNGNENGNRNGACPFFLASFESQLDCSVD